jgi:myosin heavy subunit
VDGGNALSVCKGLLDAFRIPNDQYQVGNARLFFRAGVLGQLEDTWARIARAVLAAQSRFRMARCRRRFLALKRAATVAQAHVRGGKASRHQLHARPTLCPEGLKGGRGAHALHGCAPGPLPGVPRFLSRVREDRYPSIDGM